MFVKVNTSLAGADFSYRFGEEVESSVFAARVGNGWQSLCEPVKRQEVVETTVSVEPAEATIADVEVETADAVGPAENTSKRGRRR